MNRQQKSVMAVVSSENQPETSSPTISERPNEPGWLLAAVSVGMAAASLIVGCIMPIHSDEVFYLHHWWMVAQGYIPHRDFFSYTWGFWLWVSPLAWLPWTPSGFIVFGRVLIAGCFGFSFWLVGRLVRAYRWEALVLAAVWLPIMLRTEFYTFRRAFFEILLCLVHITLLERLKSSSRPGWLSWWGGFTIGMVCLLSQRGIFYLPIQPVVLLWFLWKKWKELRLGLIGWGLGLIAAISPAVIYVGVHNLWQEEWAWNFVFPMSIQAHYISRKEVIRIILYGCLLLLSWAAGGVFDRHMPPDTKKFLAFCSAFFFLAISKNFTHYTRALVFFFITGIGVTIPRVILERWITYPKRQLRIGMGLAAVVLVGMSILDTVTSECPVSVFPDQFRIRQSQGEVLNWLAQVSQGEPIVAMDPYHPIVVPDATFLWAAISYIYPDWHSHPLFRSKLADFPNQVLQVRPPIIIANPHPGWTQGRDLIRWFRYRGIADFKLMEKVREMVHKEYLEVSFPSIEHATYPALGTISYGDTFWIRRDRFEACPPPDIPYEIRQPGESSPQ